MRMITDNTTFDITDKAIEFMSVNRNYFGCPVSGREMNTFWDFFSDIFVKYKTLKVDADKIDRVCVNYLNENTQITGGSAFYTYLVEKHNHKLSSDAVASEKWLIFVAKGFKQNNYIRTVQVDLEETQFKEVFGNINTENYLIELDGRLEVYISINKDDAIRIYDFASKKLIACRNNAIKILETLRRDEKKVIVKNKNNRYFIGKAYSIAGTNSQKLRIMCLIDNMVYGFNGKIDFADKSGESLESKESLKSKESIEASGLTDVGVASIVDRFANLITTDRKDIMQSLVEASERLRVEKLQHYEVETCAEFKTLNLYRDSLITEALDRIEKRGRLLILGDSGVGKTELAYYLAKELTGENCSNSGSGRYNRVCVVNAREARRLTNRDKTGELDVFVKHIKDGGITERCVFICNELQASDLGYLLPDLWEKFSNGGKVEGIYDNIDFIFTACTDRDFGIDEQVKERLGYIELSYLSLKESEVINKIVENFGTGNKEQLRKIVTLAAKLNDSKNCSVVSVRRLIDCIKSKDEQLKDIEYQDDLDKINKELKIYHDGGN